MTASAGNQALATTLCRIFPWMATERSGRIELSVRPLLRQDLVFAAALHTRALAHGFFPQLGERFMRRYYQSFVRSPWAVAYVAEFGGEPIGALVGTTDDRAHYRFVARRCWLPLGAAGIASLVRRPSVAWWFLRRRLRRYARGLVRLGRWRQPAGGAGGSTVRPVPREGVLTHVVVDEAARGSGAGGELVAAFVASARRRGTSHLRLVTGANNGASSFYERLGWTLVGQHQDLDGGAWAEFRLDLQ